MACWWFVNDAVVQMLDLDGLRMNAGVPPVYVEGLIADRTMTTRRLGAWVNLPARSRDIEINYTALSLAVPEKNRFRYWLEGRDTDWQDAGTRRQAFYSDLRQGSTASASRQRTTTVSGTTGRHRRFRR